MTGVDCWAPALAAPQTIASSTAMILNRICPGDDCIVCPRLKLSCRDRGRPARAGSYVSHCRPDGAKSWCRAGGRRPLHRPSGPLFLRIPGLHGPKRRATRLPLAAPQCRKRRPQIPQKVVSVSANRHSLSIKCRSIAAQLQQMSVLFGAVCPCFLCFHIHSGFGRSKFYFCATSRPETDEKPL